MKSVNAMIGLAAGAVLASIDYASEAVMGGDRTGYTPFYRLPASHEDEIAAAKEKRQRKAARLAEMHFTPVTPTNHPGAESARGDIRRMDRRINARRIDPGSAAAAKTRLGVSRADLPNRSSAATPRLSPVPEDFFRWPRSKRRAWADQRERDRQAFERDALVKRGLPFDVATARFGSL